MELIQLRYFLRVAETLNYSKAAESLYISRQSLRQTLGNLEKELGRPLFANERNHLSLTEYGDYLLHTFEGPVREFEAREAQTKDFFHRSVTLKAAFSLSLFPFQLPDIDPILQQFQAQHPHIVLDLVRQTSDEILAALNAGELDCGVLLRMPSPIPGCVSVPLRTSAVAIGSGPKSPLCGKPEITIEELASVPLVGMGSLQNIALPLLEDCEKKGLTLDYRVVPNSLDALYLIRASQASGLNTYLHDPSLSPLSRPAQPKSLLPGYTWEVAALCPTSRPNHTAAQLLADFLREKYFHPGPPHS